MTDEELIGYCELHCTTERALFHVDHLDRMLELAGRPDGYVKTCKDWVTKWYSVHEDEMLPLCNLARERMRSNVEFSGGAPLHGAASAGTQGSADDFRRKRWTYRK